MYFLNHDEILEFMVDIAAATYSWSREDPDGYMKSDEAEWYARVGAKTHLQPWIIPTAIAARWGRIK